MTQDQTIIEDPTLVDPDGVVNDSKYSWDEEFQRHIAALLIVDRQFLLQSLDIINPNYFTNKAHSKICNIVFEFFKKYRILPKKDFIVQELKTSLKENKSLSFYLAEVNVLFDYFQPGLESREYLQDKILFFAKIQAVKKAFYDSLKLIEKSPESDETWSKIYDGMREAMQVNQNFDIGLDYFKSIKDRYENKKEDLENNTDRFILGLPEIDDQIGGGGYSRGEIVSIVAGSGVGKSVMLACISSTNICRGKKGVYISLELSEQKVADRMDAILSGLPIQTLLANKDELFDNLQKLNVPNNDDFGCLIIKQFPAGTATVNTIRAYIGQLRLRGFDPDFLIVDYVGEMSIQSELKSHEAREKIVRDLRGLATEEKIFIATAMQPNRDSKKDGKSESNKIDDEHLADSFGQIRPLDGCISLNQNDTEKRLGIGRAYVIKQRDGKSRYQIYLRFDKENLRIKNIRVDEYRFELHNDKEKIIDDVETDLIKNVSQKNKIDSAKKSFKPFEENDNFGVGEGGFESYKANLEEKSDD